MPARDPSLRSSYGARTSLKAISAIRSWWNAYHLHKSDISDSTAEADEDHLAEKRQLCMNISRTLRTRQLLVDFDGGRPILSLRAPLDLVRFPSISRPRWPIECEVACDAIHHIEWEPPEPEPFYQPTGHERTPVPSEEHSRKVVYCIDHATKCPYFTCSRVGGSRGPIKNATYDITPVDRTLQFESRFESGNLQKVVQVGANDYELTLRTDMYTRKHTQWFYFRIRNMEADVTYRFTVVNLMKSSSLYSQGMRPLLYSERAAQERGAGWQRTGSNIRYSSSSSQNTRDPISLYSLTWTLQFPYESDTCYLAHCYPYTYSRLQRYLRCISSNPAIVSYCKVRVLCHSLAGNAVYVVTVTSRGVGRVDGRAKKAVVVTARVHPGETTSSWMMEGFLDFLLGDSADAQLLRDTFVFKVVPMLNPDGVVVGNSRCSLAGRDLNRNYKTLLRDSFPCVWHTRNMVERLKTETDVLLYCDFHGHNRKNNVFMYGCSNRGEVSPKLHERVFPLMMSKNAKNKFSFKSCKFRVQKSREGTGRIAMWRLGIRNSYTMEATFGGSTLGDRKGTHFTTNDLKSLGFYLCDTLLDYYDPDPTKTSHCLKELAALLKKKARERLGRELSEDYKFSVSDLETSTSGSNSSDSDGLPVHLLNHTQTVHPQQTAVKTKKKRLMSRKERNRLRPAEKKAPAKGPNLPRKDAEGQGIQEEVKRRRRKKMKVMPSLRKALTISREVSPVTLMQGREHVKEVHVEDEHLVGKRLPHLSSFTHASHTEKDTGQWKCSSQLLHFLPLQQHGSRPSYVSNSIFRGLHTPHRSPSFLYDKLQGCYCQRQGNSGVPRYFIPEDQTGASTEGGGQNLRDGNQSETEPHHSVFVPVLRGTDLWKRSISKKTFEEKRPTGVLPPVTKKLTPSQGKNGSVGRHQAEDVRPCHSANESLFKSCPDSQMVKRPSQSASLWTSTPTGKGRSTSNSEKNMS